MRTKAAVLILLLALTTSCTSTYSDGWQPQPVSSPTPAETTQPEEKKPAPEEKKPAPQPQSDVKPEPTPPEKTREDALALLNDTFRNAYSICREHSLANETYALVLGDKVVFFRGGMRRETPYTPERYDELKAVAHIPLALFVQLHHGPLKDENVEALRKYREQVTAASNTLAKRGFDEKTLKRQVAIVSNSLAFLDKALAAKGVTMEELNGYATAMGPLLLQNAADAAKLQLDGLNVAFMDWLNTLTEEERKSYHIVVSGSHQARDRNLQMTYCRQLLGETDAIEHRLIFGESCFDETSCRKLLGTHLVDEDASKAFFDDPLRLQYDLLGDAAAELVPKLRMPK